MRTISKRWPALLALVVAVVGGAGVWASHAASASASSPSDVLTFVAHLNSSQPVAGSNSSATGTATLQIDTVNKTMTTDMQWSGLGGIADRSHVHSGLEGEPAGDWMFHEVINNPFSLVDEVLPGLVDCGFGDLECAPTTGSLHDVLDIANGYTACEQDTAPFQCVVDHAVPDGFYIDMHTANYGGGEIRGQFKLSPSQVVLSPPASKSTTWKAGRTVPIKFALTDAYGAKISDILAAGLLSPTCRVQLSASGPSPLASTCVPYDPVADQFSYNLKLGKAGGTERFDVTVSYPGTTYTITKSGSATIVAK